VATPPIPFMQAKWYTPVGTRRIIWLVLHDMQAPKKGDTAEAVANYFHNMDVPQQNGASAHECIDDNSVVGCVRTGDVAWAAPNANSLGYHFEMAGYANQSTNEWLDAYGHDMLRIAADRLRAKADELGIPLIFRRAPELVAGLPGVTTHFECSQAFGGDHWDPGPNFPIAYLLSLAQGTPIAVPPSMPRPKGLAVFDPPLQFVAFLAHPGIGAWVLFPDAGIGNLGTPDRGNAHGKSYLDGMTPVALEFPSTPNELAQAASRGWGPQDCHVTIARAPDGSLRRYGPIYDVGHS
jgi:hypothetical protein